MVSTLVVLTEGAVRSGEGGRAQWLSNESIIYWADDGLRVTGADGGATRLVTGDHPVLWDASPDGRAVYAVLDRERRALELVTIDVPPGAERSMMALGRRPLSPDVMGHADSLRAMRVAPDGTALMLATLMQRTFYRRLMVIDVPSLSPSCS